MHSLRLSVAIRFLKFGPYKLITGADHRLSSVSLGAFYGQPPEVVNFFRFFSVSGIITLETPEQIDYNIGVYAHAAVRNTAPVRRVTV